MQKISGLNGRKAIIFFFFATDKIRLEGEQAKLAGERWSQRWKSGDHQGRYSLYDFTKNNLGLHVNDNDNHPALLSLGLYMLIY